MNTLQPIADRVIIKPIEGEEVTKGGIYLPDTVRAKPQEGEIIAVGLGRFSEKGERIVMNCKVGDTVVYSKYGGTEIKVDGEKLTILNETDILAKRVNGVNSGD